MHAQHNLELKGCLILVWLRGITQWENCIVYHIWKTSLINAPSVQLFK